MPSVATPTRVGPYEIVSRLGAGGMAETFVALRRGPGAFTQRVCLKRLRPDLEGDPEFVRQFMAEAAIAAQLRHAAIAQVLDFGRDGADYYLALELIEGCDLREFLQSAPSGLPPGLVLHIAVELASALDVAHRAGGRPDGAVVHRDVSPSNTLLSTAGEVKLTDFGIARALGGPKHTRTGIVKGKAPYMAPEYARSAQLDPRSDLFSLGALLYECACGVRPHDGATDLETLERADRGQHAALTERAPALLPALAEIVERLLEPNPELRCQSAASLLEELSALPAQSRARLELGALVAGVVRERPAAPVTSPVDHAHSSTELIEPYPTSTGAAPQPTVANRFGSARHGADEDPVLATPVRPGRRPLFVLAFALLCASSVLVFALLRDRRPADDGAQRAGSGSGSVPAETVGATTVASAGSAPAVVMRGEPSTAPAELTGSATVGARGGSGSGAPAVAGERAWLEVVVLPYGDVSVDGKRIGTAPVALATSPGEHTVEAHSRGNTLRRRVSLAPGERRQIVLK